MSKTTGYSTVCANWQNPYKTNVPKRFVLLGMAAGGTICDLPLFHFSHVYDVLSRPIDESAKLPETIKTQALDTVTHGRIHGRTEMLSLIHI